MTWPSACWQESDCGGSKTEGQRAEWLGGRARMGCSTWRRRGLRAHIGRGHAMAPQREENAVAEGVGACMLQTSAITAAREGGRLIRPRGYPISPGLRIHSPGLQIHAHTACRVPLPLSPISDEEVDDGGCAGVSRGRLTRGDMANADRSSRPSLPCPPEVWPSQPARRSEPTRTRPTISHSPPPRLSPPTSTHPLVSDCTVPCRYVVHPGYAYPSALLWADLLIIKSVLIKFFVSSFVSHVSKL